MLEKRTNWYEFYPFSPPQKNKNFTKSKVKLVQIDTNQVSCRLMRLKNHSNSIETCMNHRLKILIRTPRSVKPGLIIDESVRVIDQKD